MRQQGYKQTNTENVRSTQITAPNYLSPIVANTSDAMLALSQQFRILDVNAAASNTFGQSIEGLVGRGCTEVLRCRNLNRVGLCNTSGCPLTRALSTRQSIPDEELILDAESGRSYEAFTTVVPIDGESEQYVIFTAHDVSTLKVVNRVRSNFISMVSHELRTPLNSVHGFIDLLLQGHMGLLTEEQHTYLSYAQESTQQLVSIVEDILFLTRSDLGQFEIKPQEVVLHGLAVQVMSSFQSQAHKAGVILSQDIPASSLPLHVDPQRIKQLLNNLVANAIKFTPPGGTVTIRAQHFNESYEMISVVDTGYGIPAEEYSYVFERFYQSNHRLQSKVGGWGLGLAIAKLIVEQHGGNIVLDSLANEGSTFFFTLPVHKDSGKNSS